MDYSAVSQAAKRFEQKSEVNDEIKENIQKMITALKEIWMSNVETPFFYSISFKLSRIKTPVNLSDTPCTIFLKKKDFLKPLSY